MLLVGVQIVQPLAQCLLDYMDGLSLRETDTCAQEMCVNMSMAPLLTIVK